MSKIELFKIFLIFVGLFMIVNCKILKQNEEVKKSFPTPIFAWSGNEDFLSEKEFDNLEDIALEDFDSSLRSLIGLPSSNILFNDNSQQTPEVVVLFLESKMSTEHFSFYANQNVEENSLKVFHNLEKFIEGEQSSVDMPYVTLQINEKLSDSVSQILEDFFQHKSGSINLINSDNAPQSILSTFQELQNLDQDYSNARVDYSSKIFSTQQIFSSKDFLETKRSSIFSNNQIDLILVCFDDHHFESNEQEKLAQSYQHDDLYINIITNTIKQFSNDYIALFFADESFEQTLTYHSSHQYFQSHHHHQRSIFNSIREDSSDEKLYDTRFPPHVAEGLMVTLILLIILFVGLCCLCCVQTPDRFPVAPKDGTPAILLHDNGKK